MKRFLLCIFLLALTGCINQNPKIELLNNSDTDIGKIEVFIGEKCPPLIIKDIKTKERKTGTLLFCDSLKGDGSYGIKIFNTQNELIATKGFGYYSNGKSLNKKFSITVEKNINIKINQE